MRLGRPGGGRVDRRAVGALHAALAGPGARGGWLERLVRLEAPVERATIPDPDDLATVVGLRLARVEGDRVVPLARLDPVGSLLVASDLQRHRRAPDWVMSPGPASFTLARHVRPHGGGRVLDLGSGSGIQGLLLGGPRTEVLAVDVNPRALAFTAWNARLNGRSGVRPVLGDFLAEEPDRGLDGRFETVVANPPFVLSPGLTQVYRDRPLPGDLVGARTVDRVARAMAPGGRGYVLCNWIERGGAWSDPVRSWTAETGHDAVAVRLATLDAAGYAAFWTRDLPEPARAAAVSGWVAALAVEAIAAIHVGVIALARPATRTAAAPRFASLDRAEQAVTAALVEAHLGG